MPKIDLRGRSFFYEEVGNHGDPLVFLSGLGGDHRAFNRPQRHFAARYRALAFDSRDAGQSDRAEPGYTTADMADDVADWLAATTRPPHTWSGSRWAGWWLKNWRSAIRDLVKSLVLVSTHAGADAWRKAVIDSWVLLRRQRRTAESSPGRSSPGWSPRRSYRQPGQVEGLIQFAERNPWPQDAEAFARQAAAAIEHDTRDRLGSIAVPHPGAGRRARPAQPAARRRDLAERIPDAQAGCHARRRPHAARRGPDAIPARDRAVSGARRCVT